MMPVRRVKNSAQGRVSHTPFIPRRLDRGNRKIKISRIPRRRERKKERPVFCTAAKMEHNTILVPKNKKAVKYKRIPSTVSPIKSGELSRTNKPAMEAGKRMPDR